jgi:hypothetical protein
MTTAKYPKLLPTTEHAQRRLAADAQREATLL